MGSSDLDSIAIQHFSESHWDTLEALIFVVRDVEKDVGSTAGMQSSVKTSDLFRERLEIVPQRLERLKKAIKEKDFKTFAEITIKGMLCERSEQLVSVASITER